MYQVSNLFAYECPWKLTLDILEFPGEVVIPSVHPITSVYYASCRVYLPMLALSLDGLAWNVDQSQV